MKLNGMEYLVLRPVLMEKFFKTVFVSVHKANSNKKENASTIQHVKMELHGMASNVLVFPAIQVPLLTVDVDVVKPQFSPAQLVPIGMDQDAFMSLISVLPVWFGKTFAARVTHQSAQVTHTNSMVNVSHFQPSAQLASPGTPQMAVPQPATLVHQELTLMV